MNRRRLLQAGTAVAVLAVLGALAVQTCLVPVSPPWTTDHQTATVRLSAPDGETLAVVDTEVADTRCQRYRGLSGTESLANGSGMLFVHDGERELTYVMRGMNYGLDIVFVDADGRVTAVRSAPPPGPDEDGENIRRSGRGKYVLEVPRGYADRVGLTVGDRVQIEYDDGRSDA